MSEAWEKKSHCVGALQLSLALCLGPHSLLITLLLLIHQLPLGALSEEGLSQDKIWLILTCTEC